MKIVLKIGGNEIDDQGFLKKVSTLVAKIRGDHHNVVLVHGGGKEITKLLAKLNIETKFIKGFRYTDSQSLEAVEMVLSGLINKRLVKSLQQIGVNAIGLSGVDGKILVAKRTERDGEDMGFVGEVESVNASAIEELMQKFAVVLSPISADKDSIISLNVNADYAAAAVASSIKAELALFLSNVPGVLKDGKVIPELREKEFQNLKALNVIAGGMVPKIEAAFFTLGNGSGKAFITNAEGASDLVSGRTAGTRIVA
ncbi:MAG TPA: acetylglutamate kinase [Candidatus Acidoferrales bacterium]|nr:acetylglutamate kinase [Candidatus Acidoferrales bacterium]